MTNKTVLITGGSHGIGLALAKIFAGESYRLVLVSLQDEELAFAKKEIETQHKVEVITLAKNLALPSAAKEVYQWTKTLPFEIDILINNAGFGTGGYVLDIDMERELEMIDLNIKNVYQLTRLFLADMVTRDSGKIMNVASIAAFQPSPMLTTYSATKAFVFSFTAGLSYELKQKGSKVTLMALCPPPANTGFQAAAKLENTKLFKSNYVVSVEQIAQGGYRALMQGKRFVIPSNYIDILTELGNRLLPLSLKLKITYNVMTKGRMF
jgi:uncharacterized protein